jgi:hypothetical protein
VARKRGAGGPTPRGLTRRCGGPQPRPHDPRDQRAISETTASCTVVTDAVLSGGVYAGGVVVMTEALDREETMKGHSPGQAIAELTAATTMQTEATHQRMVFAWGQILCTELRRVWTQLESEEALAYEDKLAAQVHVLEEATASLRQLHHTLGRSCRRLTRQLQALRA